jgi:hypothetical protein
VLTLADGEPDMIIMAGPAMSERIKADRLSPAAASTAIRFSVAVPGRSTAASSSPATRENAARGEIVGLTGRAGSHAERVREDGHRREQVKAS